MSITKQNKKSRQYRFIKIWSPINKQELFQSKTAQLRKHKITGICIGMGVRVTVLTEDYESYHTYNVAHYAVTQTPSLPDTHACVQTQTAQLTRRPSSSS